MNLFKICYVKFRNPHTATDAADIFTNVLQKLDVPVENNIQDSLFALCKAGFTTESISINASCLSEDRKYMMLCAISWYHLYNLKNVKNTHKGVLVSVNLYVSDCS